MPSNFYFPPGQTLTLSPTGNRKPVAVVQKSHLTKPPNGATNRSHQPEPPNEAIKRSHRAEPPKGGYLEYPREHGPPKCSANIMLRKCVRQKGNLLAPFLGLIFVTLARSIRVTGVLLFLGVS